MWAGNISPAPFLFSPDKYQGTTSVEPVPHPFALFAKDSLLRVKQFFLFGKVQENLSLRLLQ